MCYKNSHSDMASIEQINFDGGLCKGEKSISQMKQDGWSVKDIQIKPQNDSYNFIYILEKKEKKVEIPNQKIDYDTLAKNTLAYKEKKDNEEVYKVAIEKYKIHCVSCHGKNGELEPNGTSRKIYTLSKTEFLEMMYEYRAGDYDNGNAFLMRPNATFTDEKINENIYKYLQQLNK